MTTIRDQARSWAKANWDPEMTVAQWWECLFEARYCLPSLPDNAFGRGYSRQEENESRRGLRDLGTLGPAIGISTMMAAPTIAAHGTPEQIERYIPPMLTGQESWCQLFSEPGAGSDLAGLQTSASRDGDIWTINGQKVWTSLAEGTDYGMLIARSDRDKPKHAGITWFAFPMRQSSVDIRPLVEMTGQAFFNEVFMDHAVVDHNAVIGDVNDGWRVANTTLLHERASLAGAGVMLPFASAGPGKGDVQRKTLHSPAPAIYGGTDQVQRNIIGERFLGLPKEPAPPPDTPFRDLPSN